MAEPDLPDAGFIYTPRSPKREGWMPAPGKCRASCSDRSGFWQCTRPAKVERDVLHNGEPAKFGYCGQHDPIKVAERRAARDAKWRAECAARDAVQRERERLRELRKEALIALKAIARGHNDPRALAMAVLELHHEPLDA